MKRKAQRTGRVVRVSNASMRSWTLTPPKITVHRCPNGKMVAVKCTGQVIWEK